MGGFERQKLPSAKIEGGCLCFYKLRHLENYQTIPIFFANE